MKTIQLTKGLETMVDDADFDFLNQWKWQAYTPKGKKTAYASRSDRTSGKHLGIKIHRLLLSVTDSNIIVDHIDGNGLNNQRSNLRIVTHLQSCYNRSHRSGTMSDYKGVTLRKETGKWRAIITMDGKQFRLGQFDNQIDAAIAYNDAAILLHGEFARLNKVG